MFIFEIVIYVFWVLIAIASFFVGVIYNKRNRPQNRTDSIQNYVKANLNIFGVSNKGTSMDERDVYLVPFSKMGY